MFSMHRTVAILRIYDVEKRSAVLENAAGFEFARQDAYICGKECVVAYSILVVR